MNQTHLSSRYQAVRKRTLELCEPLEKEDYVVQAALFASPTKWHIAHTTWFFETFILKVHFPKYKEFNPNFAYLFNSYYQTLGERTARDQRGLMSRPTVDEVIEFRKHVDDGMANFLAEARNNQILELVELGLNHEEQHQELLLTDLKYMLSLNPILPDYGKDWLNEVESQEQKWLYIKGDMYDIGYSSEGFCFDNELPKHETYVPEFFISNELVTNEEYLEFIEAGAYQEFHHWLDEAWSWIQENNISAPLYWKNINEEWHHFTLNGLQKLDLAAPVSHISFYEAQAFAQWKGMRLPTEFEWEIACKQFKWGKRWEWTASAYLPYPGFKAAEGAVGEYNGKFMINQMVLRGASAYTAPQHSRPSYRNFFHPHYQWQLTGIRLIKS